MGEKKPQKLHKNDNCPSHPQPSTSTRKRRKPQDPSLDPGSGSDSTPQSSPASVRLLLEPYSKPGLVAFLYRRHGYALFLYRAAEGAKKALEEPYRVLEGRTLHCQLAVDSARKKRKAPPVSTPAAATAARSPAALPTHSSVSCPVVADAASRSPSRPAVAPPPVKVCVSVRPSGGLVVQACLGRTSRRPLTCGDVLIREEMGTSRGCSLLNCD